MIGYDGNMTIRRKFLLYRLDLSKAPSLSGKIPGGSNGSDIQPLDIMQYDNPASPLYWRNAAKTSPETYANTLETAFKDFLTNLLQAVQNGTVGLKQEGNNPYIDITKKVRSVDGYSVSLENFNNSLAITVDTEQSISGGQIPPIPGDVGILENDVLQVRVSYDAGVTYNDEFLGLVTRVKPRAAYGDITGVKVVAFGISKVFDLSSTIIQQEVSGQEFQPGVQINSLQDISPFTTRFQSLDVKGIYETLTNEILGFFNSNLNVAGPPAGPIATYEIANPLLNGGPTAFQGFQYNLFSILTLALMNQQGLMDSPVRGVLEHGEHQAFNDMVADGFNDFFASTDKPSNIFSEIRSQAMYDTFESQDGIIICRPPRYNRIEISNSEFDRIQMSLTNPNPGILVLGKDGAWNFDPSQDFTITQREWGAEMELERRDDALKTQEVTQFTLPSVGAQDFAAGSFTDPGLLARYGLRIGPPISNPNVQGPALAQAFAPIQLGVENAATATINLPVFDRPGLRVGKLYAIAGNNKQAVVGYCISKSTHYAENEVSMQMMNFAMARTVVWLPIQEILSNSNELLNFALCYLPDPTTNAVPGQGTPPDIVGTLIQQATTVLTNMQNYGISFLGKNAANVVQSVPMFRYIPTIMDLIIQLDDNPSLNSQQPPQQNQQGQQQREQTRQAQNLGSAPVLNGLMAANTISGFSASSLLPIEGALTSDDPPTAFLHTNFLIPSGIYRYGTQSAAQSQGIPSGPNPFTAVSTFLPQAAVSAQPGSIPFSQLLVNRLASIDLAMKFSGQSLPNGSGFPQLYGMISDGTQAYYRLFGSFLDPVSYIASVNAGNFSSGLIELQDFPNLLLYQPALSEFANAYFRISSFGSLVYNMPDGHFAWLENGTWQFARIKAGQYQIQPLSGNGVKIQALGRGSFIFQDTESTTFSASIPADAPANVIIPDFSDQAGTASGNVEGNPQNQKLFQVIAPDGLYFLSPYTDMTLERMADVVAASNTSQTNGGLAPIVGYRTASQEQSLMATDPESALLSGNDVHLSGQGYDLYPEILCAESGSDLQMLPALFTALINFLTNAGFSLANVQSLYQTSPVGGVAALGFTYPSGKPGSITAQSYIHLGITNAEQMAFLNTVAPANGSQIGEGNAPNPGPSGTVSQYPLGSFGL